MSWSRYLNDKIPSVLASLCAVVTMGEPLRAQDTMIMNPFFGFEFVLTPIAVKWVCGGERTNDLVQINRLIDAFPEEAEAAEIPSHLAALQNVETLSVLLGTPISAENSKKLCSAALPLNLNWALPEDLVSGANNMLPQQERAWAVFYGTVEALN
ncbi:hypothetical protein [Shimia sagamensis]|uniref:Uncharacterized protein n=1 Tax=Shimia sagamensis TaxID=1566352 RepID=A0ABY1PD45_9RHOB|nr:hypothetical protein [Shimia sagamensis]SMP31737.1 hypothetical protein SAMN06265373_10855 [Shimia sagamensis]